jgi:hypothetical protein
MWCATTGVLQTEKVRATCLLYTLASREYKHFASRESQQFSQVTAQFNNDSPSGLGFSDNNRQLVNFGE